MATKDRRAYIKQWRLKNKVRWNAYKQQWRRRNPEKNKTYDRKAKANKRIKQFGTLPPVSTNCDACGIPFLSKKAHLDHDHKTGRFRGWLCPNCNLALGHANDSRDRLQLLINYLDKSELLS